MKDEFTDLLSTLLPRLGETKNRTNLVSIFGVKIPNKTLWKSSAEDVQRAD